MQIDNYDPQTALYWFRKLLRHPKPEEAQRAELFRDVISADLNLDRPYPEIVWFQPEDYRIAGKEWLAARREKPWPIEDDPFISPPDVFQFEAETGNREPTWGYTPSGPNKFGVLVDRDCRSTLETVAHECRHVAQSRERPGWGIEHREEAESDAEAYVQDIRNRFSDWLRGACAEP